MSLFAFFQELLHQREQLNNIESKTTKINQDLKTSQKHITGIKSIFGGIKNWWNGDKDKEPVTKQPEEGSKALKVSIETHHTSRPHPAERYKTDDGRGFYEEDEDLDSKFMKGARNPQAQQYFKPVTNSAREERLNENLGQ